MLAPWKEMKLIRPEDLEKRVAKLRQRGRTIALLNGSFDLVHVGHLHIIYHASKQSDDLIVALNTDRSIREYKSLSRPILPLDQRLQMVAALQFVDFVTHFDEVDACKLLRRVRPEVYVNGSEYGRECVESKIVEEYGGSTYIVKLLPNISTTNLIGKIRSCA